MKLVLNHIIKLLFKKMNVSMIVKMMIPTNLNTIIYAILIAQKESMNSMIIMIKNVIQKHLKVII